MKRRSGEWRGFYERGVEENRSRMEWVKGWEKGCK
jgi:hypothetical protein